MTALLNILVSLGINVFFCWLDGFDPRRSLFTFYFFFVTYIVECVAESDFTYTDKMACNACLAVAFIFGVVQLANSIQAQLTRDLALAREAREAREARATSPYNLRPRAPRNKVE